MSKICCGIGDLKKGERRGTMKECVEKGQVKYYGLKKIDSITLKKLTAVKKKPSKTNKNGKLLNRMVLLDCKIKKLRDAETKKNTKEKKDKIKSDLTKFRTERLEIIKELKKLGTFKRTSKK
jgi:hypothetical protein